VYPDLTNASIFSQAGVAMAQYEIVDPNTGLGAGPTGSIAAGSTRGMGRYIAIKNASAPNPAARVVNASGDNGRFLQPYTFNPAELGLIALGFGAFDMNAYTAFSKTKLATVGDAYMVGIGTNQPANAAQATLLITADAQDADVAQFGQARFANYFYPLLNIWSLGENAAEVQAAEFQYNGIPTQAGRSPWGMAFTQAINGFTRSKGVKLVTKFPLTMNRYIVSGTQSSVTFTLDFSPTTDQTGEAIKAFRFTPSTSSGVAAVMSSVNIATRSVTVTPTSGSFADGDVITVLYESFDVQANS
jgi:hypothetical protein